MSQAALNQEQFKSHMFVAPPAPQAVATWRTEPKATWRTQATPTWGKTAGTGGEIQRATLGLEPTQAGGDPTGAEEQYG